MCGRYTRFAAAQTLYEHFGIRDPRPREATDIAPSWNVAPQTMQPVVRLSPETGVKEMVLMRWGLVPFSAKSPTHNYPTINSRAETILEKPMFRDCFRRRRCLVPIDAYFEWQVIDEQKNTKQPWAIGLKSGKPFALGGIWDRWVSVNKVTDLLSYSIITTEPNELLAPLEDRMPVIIPERAYSRWLEPGDPQHPPVDLLRPFPSELTKAWRIKPDVGNVQNNRPDLIDPIEPGEPSKPDEPPMLF